MLCKQNIHHRGEALVILKFGASESSDNFRLCMGSIGPGVEKQDCWILHFTLTNRWFGVVLKGEVNLTKTTRYRNWMFNIKHSKFSHTEISEQLVGKLEMMTLNMSHKSNKNDQFERSRYYKDYWLNRNLNNSVNSSKILYKCNEHERQYTSVYILLDNSLYI